MTPEPQSSDEPLTAVIGLSIRMVIPLFCPDHRLFTKGIALHEMKVKKNGGEGEKFTAVAIGMILRTWRKFPWKPASRCSMTHPCLYFTHRASKVRGSGGKRKGEKHIPSSTH